MQSNSKKSSVNETRNIRSRTPVISNEPASLAAAGFGAKTVCSVEMLKQWYRKIWDGHYCPETAGHISKFLRDVTLKEF